MIHWKVSFLVLIYWSLMGCTLEPQPLPETTCDSSTAAGIAITSRDVYGTAPYSFGYPPYALDGCQLLFVAPSDTDTGQGELRLRNLSTLEEVVVAGAITSPRRPVIAGDWMAWEADVNGRSLIHLRKGMQSNTVELDGAYDHASEPRISETGLVFTLWHNQGVAGDTDIAIYDFATDSIEEIGAPGQQRFGDISTTHVAWTDFSEDPDGQLDENSTDMADIVVMDRATRSIVKRARAGKQAFPMLGAKGKLAFLDWNLVHPEPKLVAYDLRLANIADALNDSVLVDSIKTTAPYIRPSAYGEWIEWIAFEDNVGSGVWRMRTNDVASPEVVQAPSWTNRFALLATAHATFIGTLSPDQSVRLEAFSR